MAYKSEVVRCAAEIRKILKEKVLIHQIRLEITRRGVRKT